MLDNGITVNIVIDKNLKDWLNNHFDIVTCIITALCDRGGFEDWWDDLDIETRIGIRNELKEIVESYLE